MICDTACMSLICPLRSRILSLLSPSMCFLHCWCGSQPWADGYWFCDFEADLCGWDLRSPSPLKWKVLGQANISLSDPLRGPGRDHSTNTASGVKNLMRSLST